MLIHGISVKLYTKTKTGVDDIGNPVYSETPVVVNNVLVSPLSEAEVLDTLSITGRKAVYQLAIPKGDTNTWTNRKIEFFNSSWKSVGDVIEGIEDMIPLEWNKKIRVERYE